ncbi:MAG: hypothetical protein Q4C54_06845 [Clostridia bacterium]|nr:hypothetical protein [Clostridia bacterium]
MKTLRSLSNKSFVIAAAALVTGAGTHGYRLHPENTAHYQLGVTVGVAAVVVFAVFLYAGIVCRILGSKNWKKGM